MASILRFTCSSTRPLPNPNASPPPRPEPLARSSRRELFLKAAGVSAVSWNRILPSIALEASSESASLPPPPLSPPAAARKPVLGGIANTKSWLQFYGDGFSIRVPPLFDDVMEPEDFNAGLSLYGDKVKPKTFAARFASPDRSEVMSVVIRPSNQLKITFLEAKDITDLGSLKSAAKIFVPGGATLYSARIIKIKEEDGVRNYYYYEFGIMDEHVALMTAINSGKAFIAGASAPQSKWEDDGVKLRSAAISLSVL